MLYHLQNDGTAELDKKNAQLQYLSISLGVVSLLNKFFVWNKVYIYIVVATKFLSFTPIVLATRWKYIN